MPFHLYRPLNLAFAWAFATFSFSFQNILDNKDLSFFVTDGDGLPVDLTHTVDSSFTLVLVHNFISLYVKNHELGVVIPREESYILFIENTGYLAVGANGFGFLSIKTVLLERVL